MIDDDDETQEEILEKYEKMVKKLIVSSDKEVKEVTIFIIKLKKNYN